MHFKKRRRFVDTNQRRNLIAAHKTVDEITHLFQTFENIEYSVREIIASQLNALGGHEATSGLDWELAYLKGANYRFCSYLAAYKMYLDTSESILKNSTVALYEAFKSAQHYEFDQNQWYRLGYGLRNFSQHYRFPIASAVRGSHQKDISDGFAMRSISEWIFVSDLTKFKNWHRLVKTDLKKASRKISTQEIIDGMSKSIEKIHEAIGQKLFMRRIKAVERIRKIAKLGKQEMKFPINVRRPNELYGAGHMIPADCLKLKDWGPSCPRIRRMGLTTVSCMNKHDLENLGYTCWVSDNPRRH